MSACTLSLFLGLLALTVPACRSHPEGEADQASSLDAQRNPGTDMAAIAKACRWFSTNNAGHFPDTLEMIVTPDENGRTYLDDRTTLPLDPWGHPYGYELLEPTKARLSSFGADGAPGGEGADSDTSTQLESALGR